MRTSLVPLSPGRLCGTHRRLSSGSSLPIGTRAVRAASLFAAGLLSTASLAAQCPAIGNDATCGFVITVTDAGVAISATGQPTYNAPSEGGDFSVGTLIGVINNSSAPVSALGIGSPLQVFYFTDNGIDSYNGVQGNGLDQTGYGGPNAYYSDTDTLRQNGIVHFITPIPPGGGTTFFSLANNLIAPTPCVNLINGAVARPSSTGTDIRSSFTANEGMTLAQAATACGFTSFNWQQLITNLPLPSPIYDTEFNNLFAPTPFNDPPPGGYSYQDDPQANPPSVPNAVLLPVYYNIFPTADTSLSLTANQTANTLSFYDSPADPCLDGSILNICGYTAPPGAILSFQTHLVGVIGNDVNAVVQDTGIGFTWSSNFNGTSGGVGALNASHPVDPGSGTGGVTLTGYNPSTTYRYPKSLAVTTVNGKAAGPVLDARLLSAPHVATTASGLAYSRATKLFTGMVTVKNNGTSAIAGPFQVLLTGLTKGAALANATGAFAGSPYISVAGTSSIGPGDSVSVPVRFSNPSMAAIHFSPATYTGGFN